MRCLPYYIFYEQYRKYCGLATSWSCDRSCASQHRNAPERTDACGQLLSSVMHGGRLQTYLPHTDVLEALSCKFGLGGPVKPCMPRLEEKSFEDQVALLQHHLNGSYNRTPGTAYRELTAARS